ncbi:gamma-glutamylcyclotransferase [Caloramator sp. mosi_1]|uniref:gamma-glutamylcyclotransferase n=1 Tax=Caloramator sp. mosi_1 TaxID=3023090 RepID=UPI002362F59A|nr:gamma-glutamylcyclotransferase [Caloramator sp. mosi_1]WDC83319.1 gamma-glutamylcyclotransferase [Caloramator sp. mosi_1]
MKDKFLNQTRCDRCKGSLKGGRIMSMFNEECICMACKEKEMKRNDYKRAVEAELEEVKKEIIILKG